MGELPIGPSEAKAPLFLSHHSNAQMLNFAIKNAALSHDDSDDYIHSSVRSFIKSLLGFYVPGTRNEMLNDTQSLPLSSSA